MYAQSEIATDYTRDELRYLIHRYTGRSLSISQFYRWLPFALIKRKPLYTTRDAKKLIFLASQLNRVRDFEFAKSHLIHDLKTNPEKYEDSTDVESKFDR
jgi:hypothetical protein